MLLTMPVYISTYMLFSFICTVYSTDIGSMKCLNEWNDGNDIKIICIINETSLNTCPGGITGFADFTFTPNGSTIAIIQCTVDKINVDCRNVLNSDGCGCQDHSGGNYVINYNIKVNKTIHSGGSWGCAADCLKIPTEGCSNIIIVHTEDNGNITCPAKWIDGGDIQIICVINETSLTACPLGATYFVDFTFSKTGSPIEVIQCTVNAINVNCNNVLNSKGCGCQQHAGGYYVINYKVTANETSHSGGTWRCEADCLKITSNNCSNITFALLEV